MLDLVVSGVYQSYVYSGQIGWCFQHHRFYKYVWSWWVCTKQIRMRYIWIKFLYLVGNEQVELRHGFINHDSSSGPLYFFSLSKCIIFQSSSFFLFLSLSLSHLSLAILSPIFCNSTPLPSSTLDNIFSLHILYTCRGNGNGFGFIPRFTMLISVISPHFTGVDKFELTVFTF